VTARRPPRAAAALALLALLATAGCGYSLRGSLPGHLRTVAVPVLTNRTSQPNVDNILTRAIVEAFATNGRLRVVRPEQADSILEGEVTGYDLQSIAFDPAANVRQYRLVVTMNLKFRDVRENQLLYVRNGYQERADFRVPASVSESLAQEEVALRSAAVEIGRAVVSFTLERF
jgi:outer membrane lipopolysaccharide assembly protein LptE/RlpB